MKEVFGKVIEVFIPTNVDSLIDIMYVTKIGFKILCEGDIITIIEEQNEFNVQIKKNDLVIIRKQIISGKEFVDIELFEGDFDE